MSEWAEFGSWDYRRQLLRSLRARVAASLALVAGSAVGLLVYAFLVASRFAWFQNLAVICATLVLVPVAIVAMWVHWATTLPRRLVLDGSFDSHDPP